MLSRFELFATGNDGIEGWLRGAPTAVAVRLERLGKGEVLTYGELNQLLTLSREAGMSRGFFKYYFSDPDSHPWDVRSVPEYDASWRSSGSMAISSLNHLYWGLYRLYVDGLLYFGNVRSAYRELREWSYEELRTFFGNKRVAVTVMRARGPQLPISKIDSADRFLIAEQACKAFDSDAGTCEELSGALWEEWKKRGEAAAKKKIADFLEESKRADALFALTEIGEKDMPTTERQLRKLIEPVFSRWKLARKLALDNTQLYLSMVNELDVYVATSMRKKEHFMTMADFCERVFTDGRLSDLNLRYFDPTMSAAQSHEDKGLVECLMVKCAKVLIYVYGEGESYGKDAEAAMALSQGKPVIFYCPNEQRKDFFNHVHPLSRLIEFDSGVAVGAMAISDAEEAIKLLDRWFRNQMVYGLRHKPGQPGFLQLTEDVSGSTVRLQTNNRLLSSAFWNYYHVGSQFHDGGEG
jgi:hypothetical protein